MVGSQRAEEDWREILGQDKDMYLSHMKHLDYARTKGKYY
jgi:hypothetical protein